MVMRALQGMIASQAGVTVTGNRLTIRWTMREGPLKGNFVNVHAVIIEVNDGKEPPPELV